MAVAAWWTADREHLSVGPSLATKRAIPLFYSNVKEPSAEAASIRPHSRGAFRVRAVASIALESREGAGKAGCWPHPWPACKQQAGGVATGSANHPPFPTQCPYRRPSSPP